MALALKLCSQSSSLIALTFRVDTPWIYIRLRPPLAPFRCADGARRFRWKTVRYDLGEPHNGTQKNDVLRDHRFDFFGSLVFLTLLSRKSCENALTPIPVRSPRGLSIAAVKFPRPLSYTWARVKICARQPDNQDTLVARKLPRAFGAANISETS